MQELEYSARSNPINNYFGQLVGLLAILEAGRKRFQGWQTGFE